MPLHANITSASISGTTTTAKTAYPLGNNSGVRVVNTGAVPIFVQSGDSTVAATLASFVIGAGDTVILEKKTNDTHLAAITASSTATVYFSNCSAVDQ